MSSCLTYKSIWSIILCFAFAALLTVFTIAEFNKTRRYGVLMAGASIALIGTFLLVGFGIINTTDNKSVYALIIAMIVVFGLAYAASDAKNREEAQKKKNDVMNSDNAEVPIEGLDSPQELEATSIQKEEEPDPKIDITTQNP